MRVGYNWFMPVLQWPTVFVRERLAFVRGGAAGGPGAWGAELNNPHGSVVVYLGPHVQRFVSVFGALGYVPGVSCWAMRGLS